MRKTHYLKTWPEYFRTMKNGSKTFEMRENDRDYSVGDILVLQEYDPEKGYTGSDDITLDVTYVLGRQPFVPEGYVCMAVKEKARSQTKPLRSMSASIVTFISAFIITLAVVLSLYSAQDAAKQVNKLTAQKTELEGNFKALQEQIDAQDKTIATLKHQLAERDKEIVETDKALDELFKQLDALFKTIDDSIIITDSKVSRGSTESLRMRATAYDLSVESCGKKPDHLEYGITRTGTKATVGRTIAVDPNVIPLGSRVYVKFPLKYSHLDGVYLAEDTGRLVKGNMIDVFLGEDKPGSRAIYKSVMEFGIQHVEVYVLGVEK